MRLGLIHRALARCARRDGQSGTTTVEFALVFPVLIIVLYGMLEGGRVIVSREMLHYAAIHGARVATTSDAATSADVESAVIGAAPLLNLNGGAIDVTINGVWSEGGLFAARSGGNLVGVTVRYTYTPILLTKFTTKNFTAQSQVVMPGS